jgi:hypothetical protein
MTEEEEFCFVIVIFWLIVVFGLEYFDGYCTCTSLHCFHGGACESLSAFWTELRHVKFSPGLERMEAAEGWC